MADYDAPKEDGHDVMWQVIGLVILILVAGTAIQRSNLSERFSDYQNKSSELTSQNEEGVSSGSFGVFGALFPSGELSVGDEVVNKGEVLVRSAPGGQILGTQKARAKAKILEGPIDVFEKTWWRLDYKNAPDGWVSGASVTAHTLWFSILNIVPIVLEILKPFLIFIAILLVVLILFVLLKMNDLKKVIKKKKQYEQEHEIIKHRAENESSDDDPIGLEIPNLPIGDPDTVPKTETVKNRRWSNIQSLMNSHNVNDWKQAILEADMILEEMLGKMGYKGEGVGGKLKQVEKSDFITLDKAWEAHKIRNQIAHKGSGWVLSRDEAEKAIELYKKVFEEFYYV